jgi:cyclopropane fatty-acyl-phospholipid synthase-like methyltransferase
MNINQKVKAGYNKAAKNYSSEFRDQFKNEPHLEMLVNKLEKGSKILDVGCGAGKPVDSYLIEHEMQVIGIDISEEQIQLAKQFVPSATYSVKDMSDLVEGEYSVEAVVSFYAVFHTPRENHQYLLTTFNSFIKPGGYLLVTMGANDWVGKEDDFCGAEMYWSHFGADKNKELVINAGFEILFDEIDTSGNEEHLVILARKKE